MQRPELRPKPRRNAVRAALQATFGTSAVERFDPIKGGVSGAQILRFDMRERPYVLRNEPERVALRDRQRGYECMVAAATAGAAPAVHYSDPADGVAIMDFISGQPLLSHPGEPVGMMRALGILIAKVQTTPPFPAVGSYPDVIESLLVGLRKSELLAPSQLDPHAEGLSRIRHGAALTNGSSP